MSVSEPASGPRAGIRTDGQDDPFDIGHRRAGTADYDARFATEGPAAAAAPPRP